MIDASTIQASLTSKCTDEELEKNKTEVCQLLSGRRFGRGGVFASILAKPQAGDEFWNFSYHPAPLAGCRGIALVRQGKVVDFVTTGIY